MKDTGRKGTQPDTFLPVTTAALSGRGGRAAGGQIDCRAVLGLACRGVSHQLVAVCSTGNPTIRRVQPFAGESV